MARNLWVAYPSATVDEMADALAEFKQRGGKVKKLRVPDKNFRETPREKGAIYLSDREDRLLDD